MDKKVKMKKGAFYHNEIWFSPAYQALSPRARDLFQCFLTELKKVKGKKHRHRSQNWQVVNNGNISFTEKEYKAMTGSDSSYIKARNKLIEVGFIKQTYRGGMHRGDRAKYKILIADKSNSLPSNEERWRRYPDENWSHDIPKPKQQLIGKTTQWKKGQSGRKTKTTL